MVEINNCNPGWATSSFPFFLTLLTSKFLNSRSSQFSYFSKFFQTLFNPQEGESEEEEDKEGPRVDRGLDRGFDQQRVEASQCWPQLRRWSAPRFSSVRLATEQPFISIMNWLLISAIIPVDFVTKRHNWKTEIIHLTKKDLTKS